MKFWRYIVSLFRLHRYTEPDWRAQAWKAANAKKSDAAVMRMLQRHHERIG